MLLINKYLSAKNRKVVSCILLLATVPFLCGGRSGQYADIISTRVICKQPGKYIGWPSITKIRSGELLVVSYGVPREPFGEMACISRDGGETWETDKEIMINPAMNSDLGYPASVQLDDGSILTVYYQIDQRGEKPCLMSTHWQLNEL